MGIPGTGLGFGEHILLQSEENAEGPGKAAGPDVSDTEKLRVDGRLLEISEE